MPTSVPKSTRAGLKTGENSAGFSLLEMLVVLSIMAIALSVVSVGMMRSVESTRFDRSADAAVASIITLRADAMLAGEPRSVIPDTVSAQIRGDIPAATQRRLALPAGWRVDGDIIKISPTGICTGGNLRLYSGTGQYRDYVLSPPKCAASRAVIGIDG